MAVADAFFHKEVASPAQLNPNVGRACAQTRSNDVSGERNLRIKMWAWDPSSFSGHGVKSTAACCPQPTHGADSVGEGIEYSLQRLLHCLNVN